MTIYDLLDKDIKACERAIESKSPRVLYDLCEILYPKYLKIVDGINYGVQSTDDSADIETNLHNVKFIKEKLELFKALQEEHLEAERLKSQIISISNNNVNTNEITVDISFSDVREQIKNMSPLPESEIKEILLKLEELEKIVSSDDRKSQKWEKAKDIIKWVADKGVDVGIALLPLFLQMK